MATHKTKMCHIFQHDTGSRFFLKDIKVLDAFTKYEA